MTDPTPATLDMALNGQWAVRSSVRGHESIMYGPDEDWVWQTSEAVAQTPGIDWVQVLPPRELWDEWPSAPNGGWLDRLRERLFGWFEWLG